MKILVTGGHPTPALAVIEELRKHPQHEIYYVGKQFSQEGTTSESYEYKQIKKLKLPFYSIKTGRLTRIISPTLIRELFLTIYGFFNACSILLKIKPDVIMSFGGYMAIPVCFIGKLFRIEIVTHEQTISPGLANKIIGYVADKVLVSFPETIKYFKVSKTRVTGNPIRFQARRTIIKPFDISSSKPIIYITGGSLGSHSINIHIEKILDELLKYFIVIHQTGNIEKYGDFKRLSKVRRKNYYVVEHFHSDEVGWVFRNADIVVSRAGANTTFELIHYRKPSVLIPLPWSGNGEQDRQAKLLAQAGAAEVFDQYHSSDALLDKILLIHHNYAKYKKGYISLQEYLHEDAAALIVHEILE
ncbi:UDP-N-acetylglucosamine--N-acetylmuramyl-(pentapeptide) pyrophosphoryl-undecaprenol N-acetylglucosamine transferase [Candidatus Woesebacteria bacterium]|nr:UDP-N-acetylglucosamine--N-acetylmuramyl-(pentapeptide) pyrophosphoryl-undecaprenol N-acetylglucosamine transferase [Candidatus Woesebacteria bacterium]